MKFPLEIKIYTVNNFIFTFISLFFDRSIKSIVIELVYKIELENFSFEKLINLEKT